ncbi:MFS transporter [Micromonospora haikouensis]|uniref:MFS transporter n=1 Tax=Micromonospora haikouensis TaxID=686309 RepID=UPI0033E0D58D
MGEISAPEQRERAALGRGYWRLLGSVSFANLGDGIRITAFPLLALTLTRDPTAIAGLAAMEFVPWILFGPVAGAVVDFVNHRRLMLAVSLVRALVLASVAISVYAGTAELWWLYAAALVIGLGECLYDTASQVAVPQVVSSENLPRANSLLSTAWITCNEFVGPFLGARLFEVARTLPFVLHSAALFLSSALLVGKYPGYSGTQRSDDGPPPKVRRPMAELLADGFRVVRRDPVLRSVILAGAAVAAADSAWYAVLVIYVTEDIGAPASVFGILLAVSSIGGIVGGLVMERAGNRIGDAKALVAATAGIVASQVGLVLATSEFVVGALLVLSSMALAVWNIAAVTIRQRVAPPDTLGRVMGLSRSITSLAAAVSAVLGGVVAATVDVRAAFLLGIPFVLGTSIWAVRRLGARATQAIEPDDHTAGRV